MADLRVGGKSSTNRIENPLFPPLVGVDSLTRAEKVDGYPLVLRSIRRTLFCMVVGSLVYTHHCGQGIRI